MRQTHRLSMMFQCGASICVTLVTLMLVLSFQETTVDVLPGVNETDLDIDYVAAESALFQANLDYVLHRNQRSPGYFPNSFVEELQLRKRRFAERRRQLESPKANYTSIDIFRAEGDLALARMRLREDERIRAVLPSSISDTQITRRQLAVQAAEIWLKKVRDPSYQTLTDADRNRWQLTMLRKQIVDRRIERCR